MRWMRFQLASLVVCVLAASILLAANLRVRVVFANLSQGDEADQPNYTPGDRIHSNRVAVFQGWPWPVRSFKVLYKSDAVPESAEWRASLVSSMDDIPIEWKLAIWNGVVCGSIAVVSLLVIEVLLSRRRG